LTAAVAFRLRCARLAATAFGSALLATLLVGLLFAAVDVGLASFPDFVCGRPVSNPCRAAKWWSTYWWLSYVALGYPLMGGFTLAFIRWFAKSGERLAVAGVLLMTVAVLGLLDVGVALLHLNMLAWSWGIDAGAYFRPSPAWLLLFDLTLLALGFTGYRAGGGR